MIFFATRLTQDLNGLMTAQNDLANSPLKENNTGKRAWKKTEVGTASVFRSFVNGFTQSKRGSDFHAVRGY
jgi:hypothetical protein